MIHYSATTYLKEEHEKILLVLNKAHHLQKQFQETKTFSTDTPNEILLFFKEFADHLHHRKEEEILFPYMVAIPQLSGGPRCTYYSGLRFLREPIHEQVRAINRLLELDENDGIPRIMEGNPLNPILEEHLLGRKLVAAMKNHLKTFEENQQKKEIDQFFRYFSQYDFLLREHITKENECLFPMVDQYLSIEAQSKILKDFESMDHSVDENIKRKLEKIIRDVSIP